MRVGVSCKTKKLLVALKLNTDLDVRGVKTVSFQPRRLRLKALVGIFAMLIGFF